MSLTPARDQKSPPPYAIASVDNILRLQSALQLEGKLTVSVAAQRLGVAPSTAHRLLAMLVYRDFAVRDGQSYVPGPLLGDLQPDTLSIRKVRKAAMTVMAETVDELGETMTVVVRRGGHARFIAEVQCARPDRVGGREGLAFPAYRTSGGLALLARIPEEELRELASRTPQWPTAEELTPRLQAVRRQGFALNPGLSEKGIVGVGCVIPTDIPAALSVVMPSHRFVPADLPRYAAVVRAAAQRIVAVRTATCTRPRPVLPAPPQG